MSTTKCFDELVLKHYIDEDLGIVLGVNIMDVHSPKYNIHLYMFFFSLSNAEYDDEALSDTVDHTSYT